MKKRILTGMLTAMILLTGCGSSDSSTDSSSNVTVSESINAIVDTETGECTLTTLSDIATYYKDRGYEFVTVSGSMQDSDTRPFYTFQKSFQEDPEPDNEGDCYRILTDINGTIYSVIFGMVQDTTAEEAKSYVGPAGTTYVCRLASNTDHGVQMLIPVLEGIDGTTYKVVKPNLALLKLNKNTLTEESSEMK